MTITTIVADGAPASAIVVTAPHAAGGPAMVGISTSAGVISAGEHVFSVPKFSPIYHPGTRLRASATGTDHWIEGVVTAFDYEANKVSLVADHFFGDGTHDDWTLNVVGEPGMQGPRGEMGEKGDQGLLGGPTGDQGPIGIRGPEGDRGPKGETATITIGTVTTLPEGATAAVTNSGTAGAAILNFGIPGGGPEGDKGGEGPQGDPGVDQSVIILSDGTRSFTDKIAGVAPNADADDATLTTAAWVRDLVGGYAALFGNYAELDATDDYARLDGASFTGPVRFANEPTIKTNGTTHPVWHDGNVEWSDGVNGYVVFPDRFMIQWFEGTLSAGNLNPPFPTNFGIVYAAFAQIGRADLPTVVGQTITTNNITNAGVLLQPRYAYAGTVAVAWGTYKCFAIGQAP